MFNGVGGSEIKRSNKSVPAGDIVGTTDAQTLTNKTINADNNNITDLEVDNLKAGVLNTDLTGATSDTQVPSSKATKDYADTKMGALNNLGTGVQVGNSLNGGTLELRTLVAKDGIQLVQNENDIYIYSAPSEVTFPVFDKQGGGANWYKNTVGNHVQFRSFTGSNGITVAQNGDEIDSSLTNITQQGDMIVGDAGGAASTLAKGADNQVLRMDGDNPQWETLGSMADQNANAVAITGGTISGLTAPMAIADGGTGQITKTAAFDGLSPLTTQGDVLTHDGTNNVRLARGSGGKYLKMNPGGTMPEWGDGYVTPTTTQGDIIVRGAGADIRLAIGTPGQVLKVDAGGNSPEWGTLGSMSSQASDNVAITGGTMADVAITGGTISGLTTPLAIADGGTGLNALGTANYSLTTNGNADALTWMLNDRLDSYHFTIAANTDLNTIITPGVHYCSSGATTATLSNKPASMGDNAFLMIVRYITGSDWQQKIIDNGNNCWTRRYRTSTTTWSDWQYLNHPFFQAVQKAGGDQAISASTTTKLAFNNINKQNYSPEAGYGWDNTNNNFVAPFAGNFVFSLDINISAGSYITSYPALKLYLYKNNYLVSNKGTNWLTGYCNRIYNMWMWPANKGDVFDIRYFCSINTTMTYAEGGGSNYQDSGLYIWSI